MADAELAALRKQCITSLYACADNVAKYLEGNEKATEFSNLVSCAKEFCLLEAQEDVATQALEKAKRETDATNMDTLEDRLKTNLSSLTRKHYNVDNHPYMKQLYSHIKKGEQSNRANLEESDLAITESQEQFIDPITKRPITDPVKNTVCGHIYEKESIMKLLNMRKTLKCPVAGCGSDTPLLPNDLVSDDELKFRMAITQHSTMVHQNSVFDIEDTLNSVS